MDFVTIVRGPTPAIDLGSSTIDIGVGRPVSNAPRVSERGTEPAGAPGVSQQGGDPFSSAACPVIERPSLTPRPVADERFERHSSAPGALTESYTGLCDHVCSFDGLDILDSRLVPILKECLRDTFMDIDTSLIKEPDGQERLNHYAPWWNHTVANLRVNAGFYANQYASQDDTNRGRIAHALGELRGFVEELHRGYLSRCRYYGTNQPGQPAQRYLLPLGQLDQLRSQIGVPH